MRPQAHSSYFWEDKAIAVVINKRGKSGLHKRGYQSKTGGRKATESITENIPLLRQLSRQGEMPALRARPY